jgi:hypothetical protein
MEVDVFPGSRTIASSSYSRAGEVPDQILPGPFINPRFSAGTCLAPALGGRGGNGVVRLLTSKAEGGGK